ncbi:MarR family winged helix-turn-helix transcriptional regulator [Neorhizobium sp. BETTINA12A]|uniref:MarR family winged helix-turn-helix transcriptional regulator n=1 Tax=Neorhizobium sp. BETTINA12A TaxID=2908924 RepID=UPI001FF4BF03|nr:MarR family winged helix-turn-helix transcriptional regulator [Neorhizobium sp. BETTINA12A]MCJ9751591.1 MarR family winged helix-turn-helix transcriptional regulator [Neorhizobium sp. BETTINA12A]
MTTDSFELEQFLPYRLNRAAEFVGLRFAAHYKAKYGMTRPEWRTLAALGSSGRMTSKAVGAHSSMHKTKVSRAVFALEQRRWLKRSQDEADRRVEHLELTATGQLAYRELIELARRYQAELETEIGQAGIKALSTGLAAIEQVIRRSGKGKPPEPDEL